ncbi:ABC transporter permease [Rhodococcus rhodnii]|uniref:Uncharacterized protein n=2 Tax=Rhodococcus rhodnii TaxID=38312 RepID=R7WMS9_9NOCA|nr:hypothetical protein [Rhodococcus rhodnii]EOM76603.1 hypothetical protein Rrhod_2000 [Rhodococcus rhodnii LMG 5362]TXG89487.1 ABC transporter permease [Rhodococcus rhodnii]
MTTTYAGLELRRTVRNFPNMFFIVLLPGALYLIFGATQSYSDEPIGTSANTAAIVMVSMATYGAATAALTLGGSVAVERFQGWGRQLALTSIGTSGFVAVKAVVAVAVAALPVMVVFALGAVTDARASQFGWVVSALACWLTCIVFAVLGLAVGMTFRTEAAVGAAGGLLVVFAFLGNAFMPLSGFLLDLSRFTPMYGPVALARYPIAGGDAMDAPLWVAGVNLLVWTVVFATWAAVAARAATGRR